MSFVAKGGRVVTDDMLDKWADDADNGEFGGRPGAVYSGPVVPVAQADAVSRTFSLSADMSAMLDAVAKRVACPLMTSCGTRWCVSSRQCELFGVLVFRHADLFKPK